MPAFRFVVSVVLLWALPALAEPPADQALIAALRDGGNVIVLRHGAPHAEQADAKPFDPSDIVHQRLLNDQGRLTAKVMGEALNSLEVAVSEVRSSQYNRAVETATLLDLGEVKALPRIREALKSRNDHIALASIRAATKLVPLANEKTDDVRDQLAALLADADANQGLRLAALEALLALKDTRLDRTLDLVVRDAGLEGSNLLERTETLLRERKVKLTLP